MFLIFSGKRTIFLKGWFALAHEHKDLFLFYNPVTYYEANASQCNRIIMLRKSNSYHRSAPSTAILNY